MRPILFLASSAILVFANCSSNDVTDVVEQSDTIQFTAYMAGQTRAVANEASIDSLNEKGFSLYAWDEGGDSLYFKDIYKGDAEGNLSGTESHKWTSSPLSFYALYGKKSNLKIEDGVINAYVYTADTLQNDETGSPVIGAVNDVTVASCLRATRSVGAVNLQFSHILTMVTATISCDPSFCKETESGVAALKLKNITLEGPVSGYYSMSRNGWISLCDSVTTYSLFQMSGPVVTAVTDAAELVREDYGDNATSSLMLIPASYRLTVNYQDYSGSDSKSVSDVIDLSEMSGKKVKLSLNISDNHIKFDAPVVSSWEDSPAHSDDL